MPWSDRNPTTRSPRRCANYSQTEDRTTGRVLAGLWTGRVGAGPASNGFCCEGNEFSYFMLFTSAFVMNHSDAKDRFESFPTAWARATTSPTTTSRPIPDASASLCGRDH